MDLIEQRTGMRFEDWIKLPRPQRFDEQGRRLVPVISLESVARASTKPMNFDAWVKELGQWPLGILVEPQPGDAVEFKLVNFTGRIVGRWSFDRDVYETFRDGVTTSGQSLLEYVVNAIAEKCQRQKGGGQ